jgi:endoglucanase
LREITEAPGASGYEDGVREVLRKAWEPLTDSQSVGKSGTLVATKLGTQTPADGLRRRVMITAHMDENALIVNTIDGGYLKVKNIGAPDARTLPGTPVIVHGKQPLRGVIGIRPQRSAPADQQGQYVPLEDLFVDLALPAEQVAALVSVGDIIYPDVGMLELQNNRVAGKAMDDRSCIAIITLVLDLLQSRKHHWDVLAVATTQEEVTLYGAVVEGHDLFPDLAIALDVTFGDQSGGGDPTFKLGDGPTLGIGPNFHPALYDSMMALAEKLDITVHPEATPGHSGTDAWEIQIVREGVPSALIGLPSRNMHTPIETVDLKDMERTARWLAEFIVSLTPDYMDTIVWDKPDDKGEDKTKEVAHG